MKLREKIKRLWTLDVHNHEGFTLVELIIVIAILAILSSVAVVGYSSYVKKANMQADRTLVAEVANALTLYYYSNSNEFESGYVVICPEGVDAKFSNDAMNAAMVAAYGEEWAKQLHLKYNEWLPEGADGSVIVNMDPETITDTVGALTGLAGAASSANNNEVIKNVLSLFCGLTPEQTDELTKYQNEENYGTIATNLMVKYLADEIGEDTVTWTGEEFVSGEDGTSMSTGANYAMQYAMLYTMANSEDAYYSALAKAQLDTFNTDLENIVKAEQENSKASDVTEALESAFNKLYTEPCQDAAGNPSAFVLVFKDYIDANGAEVDGITSAMAAMSGAAKNYNDLETLSNQNLFNSTTVVSMLQAYQLAAANGGIAIVVDETGTAFPVVELS